MAAELKTLAKAGYGALFVLALPSVLLTWEHLTRGLIALPVYGEARLAWGLITCGVVLIAAGMWRLWREGGGLPMNAFPPPRLATGGVFRWVAHPIYVGFTLLCWSVSMLAESASGVWLVTPMVGLGCAALVVGYEGPDLTARFGKRNNEPRVVTGVFLPWLVLFEVSTKLAPRSHVLNVGMEWEKQMRVAAWTELVYLTTYLVVPLVPLFLRKREVLKRFAVQGWLAMGVAFPIYWTLPTLAPRRDVLGQGVWPDLLRWEQAQYPPTAAFPSFHVLWSILAAKRLGRNGQSFERLCECGQLS